MCLRSGIESFLTPCIFACVKNQPTLLQVRGPCEQALKLETYLILHVLFFTYLGSSARIILCFMLFNMLA